MLGTSNVKIEAVVVKLMLSNRKPTGSKNQKLLLRSFSTEITSNHMGNSHLFILSSDNFTVKYFTVDQSTPIMSFFIFLLPLLMVQKCTSFLRSVESRSTDGCQVRKN